MRLAPALGASLAALALAAGCSAMISADLGSVHCSQEGAIGPPACPAGQWCHRGDCQGCASADICGDGVDNDCNGLPDDGCGADAASGGSGGGQAGAGGTGGSEAGGTGGSEAGGTGGSEAGGGGGGTGATGGVATGGTGGVPAGSVGAPCQATTDCQSGLFCADPSWFGAAGPKICSRACCVSDECGSAGAVCYPSATGASVCLEPTSVGRPGSGAKPLGSACVVDEECRSGICEAGKCSDSCCNDSQCPGSQVCTLHTLKNTTRQVMMCAAAPGAKGYQSFCQTGSECISGVCKSFSCSKPCCTQKDCAGLVNLLACGYSDGVRVCGFAGLLGSGDVGAPCTAGSQCKSAHCVDFGKGGICTDACCSDKDCGDPLHYGCRPANLGGSTLLLCAPL